MTKACPERHAFAQILALNLRSLGGLLRSGIFFGRRGGFCRGRPAAGSRFFSPFGLGAARRRRCCFGRDRFGGCRGRLRRGCCGFRRGFGGWGFARGRTTSRWLFRRRFGRWRGWRGWARRRRRCGCLGRCARRSRRCRRLGCGLWCRLGRRFRRGFAGRRGLGHFRVFCRGRHRFQNRFLRRRGRFLHRCSRSRLSLFRMRGGFRHNPRRTKAQIPNVHGFHHPEGHVHLHFSRQEPKFHALTPCVDGRDHVFLHCVPRLKVRFIENTKILHVSTAPITA